MTKFSLIVWSLLAGPILAPAYAQVPVTYLAEGRALFTVEAPDFWTVRTGGVRSLSDERLGGEGTVPRVLGLQPTAEPGVFLGFMSPDGVSTLQEAQDYVADLGRFVVEEPVVTQSRTGRIAGRRAESFSGTGRRDGAGLSFTVALIELPGSRVAIGLAVFENGVDPDFGQAVSDIFGTFRLGR
ncbi:MAG: hypothetical protein AAF667_15225 [Pseudomonadota bacterium]